MNEVRNIAASTKEKLKNIAVQKNIEFQHVQRQYVYERFLYRLSLSPYCHNLIIKGAMLLIAYKVAASRPTKDIDLLGKSIPNNEDEIRDIIKAIIQIPYNDGITFDAESIHTANIVEGDEYHGIRVKFDGFMDRSRIRLHIDIGFGDKIVNGPIQIEFPVILNYPAPKVYVYSLESAIAEKFEAIVSLQLTTSRMKDFYDIIFLSDSKHLDRSSLKEAITTTFAQRNTDIEHRLLIYKNEFKMNPEKQLQWDQFLKRNNLNFEPSFRKIVELLEAFIEPVVTG